MAKRNNVNAQVLGGGIRVIDEVETVGDVMAKLDLTGKYSMSINGTPAEMHTVLPTTGRVFVTFAEMVKGN